MDWDQLETLQASGFQDRGAYGEPSRSRALPMLRSRRRWKKPTRRSKRGSAGARAISPTPTAIMTRACGAIARRNGTQAASRRSSTMSARRRAGRDSRALTRIISARRTLVRALPSKRAHAYIALRRALRRLARPLMETEAQHCRRGERRRVQRAGSARRAEGPRRRYRSDPLLRGARTLPRRTSPTLSLPAETLVPSLWSEGILRAPRQPRCADDGAVRARQSTGSNASMQSISTAGSGWAARLTTTRMLPLRNWAIFFLRYSAFAPPLPAGETDEIAADNAVYDRAAILQHPTCCGKASGSRPSTAASALQGRSSRSIQHLVVVHHGTVSRRRASPHQRHLHGRAYGIERAERGSFGRNLLLLAVEPAGRRCCCWRASLRELPDGRAIAPSSWSHCLGWSGSRSPGRAGEAGGYASTLFARRTAAAAHFEKARMTRVSQ